MESQDCATEVASEASVEVSNAEPMETQTDAPNETEVQVEPQASTEEGEKAEEDNPDLEDGEIEDDDDDDEIPPPQTDQNDPKKVPEQILPAAVPTDTNAFKKGDSEGRDRKRRRDSGDKKEKGDRHLTEAEKSVRYLHKLERAERERRERLRKEQFGPADDWAVNVEKAIASVLKKADPTSAGEEGALEEEKEKRGKKRRKKGRDRARKNKKIEEKPEEIDEDEMLQVRGGSPENKMAPEKPPSSGEGYESYDSEYDSDNSLYRNRRRRMDRDGDRDRRRNRDGSRRDRKNFKDKKGNRKSEQNRAELVDANGICLFYMQGKCHRGDECPYSHDALPPLKMELCKFYLMDCCAKRDKCLYMHSEFPCKFYHTGLKCFAKDDCKFAHGKPLNDTLKQILLKHIETAPKEILGEFPRLSRDGAQNLVNQTQKALEVQYGINNGATQEKSNTTNIPSLFDINVPVPPELMNQSQPTANKTATNTNTDEVKPKAEKPEKERKRTRWNDEPPVPVAQLAPFMNPAFNGLTLQDQQKLAEYQMNFQMKGFYSESDQDMRNPNPGLVTSNGDVDMRSLPLSKTETPQLQELPAAINSNMDMDHRVPILAAQSLPQPVAVPTQPKTDNIFQQQQSFENNDDNNTELNLNIDEKSADSGCDLPSNLPKKQRELFLRIQAQQKENTLENQKDDDDDVPFKDDDWYSSDDDNEHGSKMVIHLEEEEKPKEEVVKSPPHILSPPTIKPEVIDKLGDLSKIDISAEVTKLLTSIKSTQQTQKQSSQPTEVKNSRDPRQMNASTETPATSNSDPRQKAKAAMDRRESNTSSGAASSIYEQGFYNPDTKLSIYEQGTIKQDTDLRSLESASKDLDMRSLGPYGDTDLRAGGRQDVDLRQLNLPFKAIQNYTPASEIDASIGSHSPIPYRVHIIDIPRPDYSGLKLNSQDSQVNADPRLRKIFRVPSTDEKESPASPTHQPHASPPKATRVDPRRRPEIQKMDNTPKDHSSMTYSQQLQLLQNSAFYQSLTSKQKLMLNQEISSKADQNAANDPILLGILSNIGLINSGGQNNSSAMNILANVNSMVNPMNPMLAANQMGPMGQNMMGNMGPVQGMVPIGAPGLLGAAPGIPNMGNVPNIGNVPNMGNVSNMGMPNVPNMGPNMGNVPNMGMPNVPNMGQSIGQNEFGMNYDPRNPGLLGNGPNPYQNFPNDNNFGQFNDDFYNDNNDQGNFGGNNFNNNRNRNFRNDRNQNNNRRGRNWNNRNNVNNRNNRNNNRNNRNNRSYTPP